MGIWFIFYFKDNRLKITSTWYEAIMLRIWQNVSNNLFHGCYVYYLNLLQYSNTISRVYRSLPSTPWNGTVWFSKTFFSSFERAPIHIKYRCVFVNVFNCCKYILVLKHVHITRHVTSGEGRGRDTSPHLLFAANIFLKSSYKKLN